MKSVTEKIPSEVNYIDLTHKAMSNLKNLTQVYREGDIEGKLIVIGSTFSKKWNFSDVEGRTTYLNKSIALMCLINKGLEDKKNGVKAKKCNHSGNVPLTPLYTNKFLDDLKAIANIKIFLDENHVSRDFKIKYKRCYTDNESKRNSLSKLYKDDCLQLSKPKNPEE